MRARGIKPGFFKNEELAELPPLTRILFEGLWCLADREGRLEDRPKRIKAEVLPYDNGSVEKMLDELTAAGFICRYEAAECRYIQVWNFTKHQSPHMKEAPSSIPAPDEHQTSLVQTPDEPEIGCQEVDTTDGGSFLTPSSLTPDCGLRTPDTVPRKRGTVRAQFEAFWEKYPHHAGTGDAERAFAKALKKADYETILAGLSAHLPAWRTFEKRFIPHASTWLNQARWQDDPPEPDAQGYRPDPEAEAAYLSQRIAGVGR